jgi:hypothetical protein
VSVDVGDPDLIRWTIPAALRPCGAKCSLSVADDNAPNRDAVLISALRRAHKLLKHDAAGLPIIEALPQSRYEFRLMRLALLSPRIQRDIVTGRQPPTLRLEDIVMSEVRPCWAAQERVFKTSSFARRA